MSPKTNFFRELFSSDRAPSVRLVGAGVLLALVAYLEIRFATKENVTEIINSNLIAIGSYFGIGAARIIGEKAAATPSVDNSKTEIKSDKTDVTAQNVSMNNNAPE